MTEEIVTIAKCQSLPEAEACKLRLESEGLTVFLTDAETIRTDWALSNAIGGIKVQVPSTQIEAATELLKQIRQRHDQQAAHVGDDFCLSCGAVMSKEKSKCEACGWSYAVVPDAAEPGSAEPGSAEPGSAEPGSAEQRAAADAAGEVISE